MKHTYVSARPLILSVSLSLCVLLLAAIVAAPQQSASPAHAQTVVPRRRVLVESADIARQYELKASGGRQLADYGSFQLWQPGVVNNLSPDVPSTPPSALDSIWLRGNQYIDTRTFAGALRTSSAAVSNNTPAALLSARTAEPQLALVQFIVRSKIPGSNKSKNWACKWWPTCPATRM